jgi:hypothetical protein
LRRGQRVEQLAGLSGAAPETAFVDVESAQDVAM